MARNTKRDQLRGVQMFSACTDKELAQIARACDEMTVDRDTVIVAEGTPGEDFFLIVTGEAAVSRGGRIVATVVPARSAAMIASCFSREILMSAPGSSCFR